MNPFGGAGAVALISKRKARRFIGSGISKERYDTAVFRISQEEKSAEPNLFPFRKAGRHEEREI